MGIVFVYYGSLMFFEFFLFVFMYYFDIDIMIGENFVIY